MTTCFHRSIVRFPISKLLVSLCGTGRSIQQDVFLNMLNCRLQQERLFRTRGVNAKMEQKRVKRRQKLEMDLQKLRDDVGRAQVPDGHETWSKLSVPQMRQKVQAGDITSLQLLAYHQKKALLAQGRTNCINDVVKEAETWAKEADSKEVSGSQLLAGIPISIKDHYSMKGYDVSCGVTRLLNQPYEDDCVIIKVLRKHGAIPFVRTNVPMMFLSMTTNNNVFGSTVNPFNTSRISGGSSGGEAALVASGGSPLGFGSDLGGSIRQPASMCGLYGLRPTSSRISAKGLPPLADLMGNYLFPGTFGPIARDPDSIVTAMRALWDGTMFDLDPSVVPLTFNEDVFSSKRPLRIGYYYDLGRIPSCFSAHRAVEMAVDHLKALGHEVVEWSPKNPHYSIQLGGPSIRSGGSGAFLELLSEDEPDSSASVYKQTGFQEYKRQFLCSYYSLMGNTKEANIHGREWGAREVWKMALKLKEYYEMATSHWKASNLDAVIGPVWPVPAPPLGYDKEMTDCIVYTMLWSVLDYSAGAVPITRVSSEDLKHLDQYKATTNITKRLKESQVDSAGLPVGVQVIGPRYQDELVMRIMKELETVVDYKISDLTFLGTSASSKL